MLPITHCFSNIFRSTTFCYLSPYIFAAIHTLEQGELQAHSINSKARSACRMGDHDLLLLNRLTTKTNSCLCGWKVCEYMAMHIEPTHNSLHSIETADIDVINSDQSPLKFVITHPPTYICTVTAHTHSALHTHTHTVMIIL